MNGLSRGVISYINEAGPSRPNFLGGVYTGEKWQCIEFVRRFLILNYGKTLPDVKNVYELWKKRSELLGFDTFDKSHNFKPRPDDLVLLHYPQTGHIAVVVAVDARKNIIYVADQNYSYGKYWDGLDYAYCIPLNHPQIFGWLRIK